MAGHSYHPRTSLTIGTGPASRPQQFQLLEAHALVLDELATFAVVCLLSHAGTFAVRETDKPLAIKFANAFRRLPRRDDDLTERHMLREHPKNTRSGVAGLLRASRPGACGTSSSSSGKGGEFRCVETPDAGVVLCRMEPHPLEPTDRRHTDSESFGNLLPCESGFAGHWVLPIEACSRNPKASYLRREEMPTRMLIARVNGAATVLFKSKVRQMLRARDAAYWPLACSLRSASTLLKLRELHDR